MYRQMSDWVRTRLPSKKSKRSSKQSLNAGCSFAMPFTSFLLELFFAMVSRSGDKPAWSLCSREICGSGRTSRTSFGGQKVEAILHRDPLRLREKRVLASCLNAKEGNMPWQRLPDLHRYCGSQSPVCYCYTKPPCCRVSPASTKNHEYESQKDRGACLSRLSTLSLGGCPSFRAVS